jgi:outer membrane protein TolC
LLAHERRLQSEKKKFDEALERYRSGRETTNRLIDFENDLQISRLALDEDRIALEQRRTNLIILLGRIWQSVDYDKGP